MKTVDKKSDFETGVILVLSGHHVNVLKVLKEDFHKVLNKGLIDREINFFSMKITPFKKYYRFKREITN